MGTQEDYWEHIEGKAILGIDAALANPDAAGSAAFEALRFYVDGYCLQLDVDADTDEILVRVDACALPGGIAAPPSALKGLVGKEFFWLWVAENSQGYRDTVMMSFADLIASDAGHGPVIPQIAFVGAASTLQMLLLFAADD